MANGTPTVKWLCVEPMAAEVAIALFDHRCERTSSPKSTYDEICSGQIGLATVVVARPDTRKQGPGETPSSANHLGSGLPESHDSEILVITGCVSVESLDVSLGDVLIKSCSVGPQHTDDMTDEHLLQRAINVLRGEVGEEGYWLSSSFPNGSPLMAKQWYTRTRVSTERYDTRSPRLHYLYGDESLKEHLSWERSIPDSSSNKNPTAFILGVSSIQASESDIWITISSQNVASYTRELIDLITDPSVKRMPFLKGTEKVVGAPQSLQLQPFPPYRHPSHGEAILLVIPTENKDKIAVFEECIRDRIPTTLKVQTITLSVGSDVGEQPYNDAGAVGAYNRICNAMEKVSGKEFAGIFERFSVGVVLVASIENYIHVHNIERPADFAIAAIHNATTGQTSACSSRGVTVPPEFVKRAQRFGNDGNKDHGKVTVGQVLAARVPGLDRADWHAVLAGKSRYELLREAVMSLSIPL